MFRLSRIGSYKFDLDNKVIGIFSKKIVFISSFVFVIAFASLMLNTQLSKEFIDEEFYPVEAVKYIKENIDINKMKIFNEYNFGSYLLHHDIPVFIDSRADLYASEYSGLDYDILDDFFYMPNNYSEKFDFYGITHVLIYKEIEEEVNPFYSILNKDINYKVLYEDDYFVLYERKEGISFSVSDN